MLGDDKKETGDLLIEFGVWVAFQPGECSARGGSEEGGPQGPS